MKEAEAYSFKRDVEKLFELMDGKGYEEWPGRENLKKTSRDFSTGRAESAISAAVFASDAYIAQGQEALARGDRAKLEECLKSAIEIWPKNPRLLPLRNAMMAAGQQSHALEDFKRFHKNKNYRRIFDNQHEFAVIIRNSRSSLCTLAIWPLLNGLWARAPARSHAGRCTAPGRNSRISASSTRSCSSMSYSGIERPVSGPTTKASTPAYLL